MITEANGSPFQRREELMTKHERMRGCLLGLAAGDAVGTTVEFQKPGSFPPVTEMNGGGPFSLNPGEWTDDTSMALCLATSFVECGRFDAEDQMNRYCQWWDEGYLSSNGRCFDIGGTVRQSLARFKQSGEPMSGPTDELSAGNGCIMRLAPVPMFYVDDLVATIYFSGESSRTTHGTAECVDASRYLGLVLHRALNGSEKDDVIGNCEAGLISAPAILDIATGAYQAKKAEEIIGSGYVVRSLEAALWSFATTDSFEAAILKAVNLGDDADTTAAICGQVAGAYYGEGAIPQKWLEQLAMVEEIRTLATQLADAHVEES